MFNCKYQCMGKETTLTNVMTVGVCVSVCVRERERERERQRFATNLRITSLYVTFRYINFDSDNTSISSKTPIKQSERFTGSSRSSPMPRNPCSVLIGTENTRRGVRRRYLRSFVEVWSPGIRRDSATRGSRKRRTKSTSFRLFPFFLWKTW